MAVDSKVRCQPAAKYSTDEKRWGLGNRGIYLKFAPNGTLLHLLLQCATASYAQNTGRYDKTVVFINGFKVRQPSATNQMLT